jgi:hypothetical protein
MTDVYCLAATPWSKPRRPSPILDRCFHYIATERVWRPGWMDSRGARAEPVILDISLKVFDLDRRGVEGIRSSPLEETARIDLHNGSARSRLHIGTRPFGFVEDFSRDIRDIRVFRQALPMPCSRLAPVLTVEEIRDLKGKIPESVRSELLAAKLKET